MTFRISIIRSDRTRRCAASSGGNPRSFKTFPLERVIFTAISFLSSSTLKQALQPCLRDFNVRSRRLLPPLFERVKHIDGLRELGDIEHTVRQPRPNPYFVNPWPNGLHGLHVSWFQALLNEVQFVTSSSSCVRREA